MNKKSYRICKRCVMDTTAEDITFNEEGICNFCEDFFEKQKKFKNFDKQKELEKLIKKIKEDGKNKKYDCIIGISGGIDSSYTLYLAKSLGLRILAVHLDNGGDDEFAVNNIINLTKKLKVDLYNYVIDWEEYKDLMQAFFKANVVDTELIADNAIWAICYRQASKYGVKYILAGTNFTTEGIRIPNGWNWFKLDKKNIKSIHKKFGNKQKIKTVPLIGVIDYIYYRFIKGIKWISFLDYFDYNKNEAAKLLKEKFDFIDYPYKHYESVFTRFYQGYILPKKFGIDKRKVHLSNLICCGQMTREEALKILEEEPYPSKTLLEQDIKYFLEKLDWSYERLEEYLKEPGISHEKYGSEKWIFDWLKKIWGIVRKVVNNE